MARVEISEAVQDTAGNVIAGASVQVNVRDGGAATLYAAPTGATTVGNPRTTTATGQIDAYVEQGSYTLVTTKSGYTFADQPFEAAPGNASIKPSDDDSAYFLGPLTQAVSQRAGNDSNDGLSWGTAKATIDAAVEAVPTGGLILVEPGYYYPEIALPLLGHEYRGMIGHGSVHGFAERPYIYATGLAGNLFEAYEGGGIHNFFIYTDRSDSGAMLYGKPDATAATTLSGAHTNSVTTLTVASTADFPTSGKLLLDWSPGNLKEVVTYTGKTAGTFTGVTRGALGTRALAHASGATVDTPRVNHLRASNLRITGLSDTNTWTRIIDLDGSNLTTGIRTCWFDKLEMFGCKTAGETVRLNFPVHLWFTNSCVVAAPASVEQGIKVLDSRTEEVYFDNFELLGDFYSEAAGSGDPTEPTGVIFRGQISKGISRRGQVSFGTGSKNNIVEGDVPFVTSDLGTNNKVIAQLAGGDWTAPTLLNSWVNVGSPRRTAAYKKFPDGMVELRGWVQNGTAAIIFTLPTGFRPAADEIFATDATGVFGRIIVYVNGDVQLNIGTTGAGATASLSGIRFQAA